MVSEIGTPYPRLGREKGVIWGVDGWAGTPLESYGNLGPFYAT